MDLDKQLMSIMEKEWEIEKKIKQLTVHEELWPLLAGKSCTGTSCWIRWTTDLAKLDLNNIISYFCYIQDFCLETLQQDSLAQLGELLVMYYDKRLIYEQVE